MKIYKLFYVYLLTAGFITGCGNGSGGLAASLDLIPPTVSATSPAASATNVALNRKIVVTFSEAMDPAKLTLTSFTLLQGATPVLGTITSSGAVATFTPASNLVASASYTALVSTEATDLSGNALTTNYTWIFSSGTTADSTAPSITSTNPANADTDVAINKTVAATFSEEIDPLTLTSDTVQLTGPGSTLVTGAIAFDLTNNVATFTPDNNFASGTTFTATITTGVQDLAGNALASNASWSFTTGTATAQTVSQDEVPLGSSSPFVILASAGITNIPTSMITGDVGLSPGAGSNISGFSSPATCPEVIGAVYAVDATGPACALIDPSLLTNAKADAEIAFNNARDAARGTPQAISGNLNGLTLYPGLYESGTSLEISPGGFLYLDAQGDSSAIFIIRSATTITTESTSQVILTKSAKAANVYWTAGSAVTLGVNSVMKGNMIAGTALSLQTGANLEGRALTQGASAAVITLDACTITVPTP